MTGSVVTLLDAMGSDLTVSNCARASFRKRKDAYDETDTRLIGFLAREEHQSPFFHPQLSFHVRAPIFVARQLFRHKVGLAESEASLRYLDRGIEVWAPDAWRKRAPDKKQGSLDEPIGMPGMADLVYGEAVEKALVAYGTLLELGVAPEQARSVLPLATFTEFVWTGSLMAFARVCRLRLAPDAQAETREVARQIAAIAAERFPVSWAALVGDGASP